MSVLSEKVSHDTIMAMAMAEEIDKLRAENERLCVEVDTLLDIINCVHEALHRTDLGRERK